METCILHGELHEIWERTPVSCPMYFRILTTESELIFRAAREEAALLSPEAEAGAFTPDLWRYHCAELFLSAPEGAPYAEFNLAPNGAWWCCLFREPRVAISPQPEPKRVYAHGRTCAESWQAELHIPLDFLTDCGISLPNCRYAVGAALPQNGHARWLTTMPHDPNASPDFHTPGAWPFLPV